ncbi:MAG: glycosyltransferase family 2 protein [Lachnospiraceae bacterium]|nr:glycosyltransferase family 2 protein [Lachnospiraceae bacterium]
MELISIIVPVYQAQDYIMDCVDSILAQTDLDYELILVDDGSRDFSGRLCDEYAEIHPQIRVFHTENRGAAAARNYGIDQAKGDWITFIDSDDTVEKDHLGYLRWLQQETGAQIVKSGHEKCRPVDLEKRAQELEGFERHTMADQLSYTCYEGTDGLKALLYQEHFMSVPWGMLMEKKLWEGVRFPEGTEAEDMGTIYRIFARSQKTVYGEHKTYHYLQRGSSTMYATSRTRNPAYYRHSRQMLLFVKENYPECYAAALSRHFSACCQILSETPLYLSGTRFGARLKQDIQFLAKRVRKDGECRRMNRMAARLARVSPSVIHGLLRTYYVAKKRRL